MGNRTETSFVKYFHVCCQDMCVCLHARCGGGGWGECLLTCQGINKQINNKYIQKKTLSSAIVNLYAGFMTPQMGTPLMQKCLIIIWF